MTKNKNICEVHEVGLTMKQRELIDFLEAQGYRFIRAKGGSHHIYGNGLNSFPIPIHGSKDFGEDFIRMILRETGISKQSILDYLNR
jgi:predicted RNA binding protein YcfA (HicA-like mRNA interferase family)